MAGFKVVAWFPRTAVSRATGYNLDDVPARWISHLIYCFARITLSGSTCSVEFDPTTPYEHKRTKRQPRSSFDKLRDLKARQPHLKIVFGVGGWKYTGGSATPDAMSAIVSDPALRQQFVQSCVSLWRGESDLCDGLDLDWEHPKGSDRTGLTQLLVELRQALDRERRGLLLSVSVRCDVLSGYDAPVIRDSLDFVNAMTYLLGPRTSYNAPLTSGGDPLILKTVVSQMQLAEAAGFPKDKLLLGVQAYAHGGTGVGSTNNGLHQPASGGLSNRKIPYREAVQRYVSPSFTRYWNAAVPAAHFYSASEQMFVNVQSPEEVLAKAQYVQAQGYGGLMLWTLDADVLSGASSLIQTAGGVLTP